MSVCKESKWKSELGADFPVTTFYLFNPWNVTSNKARFQIKATKVFRVIWEGLQDKIWALISDRTSFHLSSPTCEVYNLGQVII